MKNHIWLTTCIFLLLSSPALARRGERSGFNFGTTMRASGYDSSRHGSAVQTAGDHESADGQSIKPYLGYATGGIFNFGLNATVEKNHKTTTYPTSEKSQTEVTQSSQLRGAAIFGRLLFGQILYFEGSIGGYSEKLSSSTEQLELGGNGTFTGTRTDSSLRAFGTGYSFGGGFELPISYGFYFTGNYSITSYRLREVKSSTELGSSLENQESKALAFGIAYYGN